MIIPRFSLTQDHNYVVLTMKLIHVRIKDMQIVVDGTRFTFHASPYFLRLTFDQEIVEDETAKATFNPADEEMVVLIPKKVKGETFTDLDCITKLLGTEMERKKLIEEVGGKDKEMGEGEEEE
eukprot:Sspe_Gene.25512::Locus_10276_Transcript_1_1_Confidence_1.000_Length_418::g.25512::m.25512/K14764/SHQ1; protein SHQ1